MEAGRSPAPRTATAPRVYGLDQTFAAFQVSGYASKAVAVIGVDRHGVGSDNCTHSTFQARLVASQPRLPDRFLRIHDLNSSAIHHPLRSSGRMVSEMSLRAGRLPGSKHSPSLLFGVSASRRSGTRSGNRIPRRNGKAEPLRAPAPGLPPVPWWGGTAVRVRRTPTSG
jgi:hypothetical protein